MILIISSYSKANYTGFYAVTLSRDRIHKKEKNKNFFVQDTAKIHKMAVGDSMWDLRSTSYLGILR